MHRSQLVQIIKQRASYLSVGLDTDLDKIPEHLLTTDNPIFEFNKAIIDATRDLCVAYKPNVAFYESYGEIGWRALRQTINYIGKDHFIIADAKRGDIGNTSQRYAKAFFEDLGADGLTIAPYMGSDSVQPFFGHEGKWVILLALTSNAGSSDFQNIADAQGVKLYEKVINSSKTWGSPENLMYVVGATHPAQLAEIRGLVPDHFFLIPGVGAQGGDLQQVSDASLTKDCGILVNSSRGIIYASKDKDFADAARQKALVLQQSMKEIMTQKEIL